MPERKHLVIVAGGSDKSHTFWHCARGLLNAGKQIPLFLPVGHLNHWTEAIAIVREAAPQYSPEGLLADERVCVFLDSRSEFSTDERTVTRQKALCVLANSKFAEVGGTVFKVWSLEPLSIEQVIEIRGRAYPGIPALPAEVVDSLRFP